MIPFDLPGCDLDIRCRQWLSGRPVNTIDQYAHNRFLGEITGITKRSAKNFGTPLGKIK